MRNKPKNLKERKLVDTCMDELVDDCKKITFRTSGRLGICSGIYKESMDKKGQQPLIRLCMGLEHQRPLHITLNVYEANDLAYALDKTLRTIVDR